MAGRYLYAMLLQTWFPSGYMSSVALGASRQSAQGRLTSDQRKNPGHHCHVQVQVPEFAHPSVTLLDRTMAVPS